MVDFGRIGENVDPSGVELLGDFFLIKKRIEGFGRSLMAAIDADGSPI